MFFGDVIVGSRRENVHRIKNKRTITYFTNKGQKAFVLGVKNPDFDEKLLFEIK